jgi:hypothetical protein
LTYVEQGEKGPTEAGVQVLAPKIQTLYFSDELSVLKMPEIAVPMPRWLARIASAMPAMTNPYSTAVAADRSAKKPENKCFKTIPSWQRQDGSSGLRQRTLNPGLKEFANPDG